MSVKRIKQKTIFVDDPKNPIHDRKSILQPPRAIINIHTAIADFHYSAGAIEGFTKNLEKNYSTAPDNEEKRLFNRIKANAKKMGLPIEDFLEFSRLRRKEIRTSRIQMTELVEATPSEINTTINQEAAIKVHQFHFANADIAMLKQVMLNLLSHAIKYFSKTKKQCVEIKSHLEENEIIYSVRDSGVGFNNQYVEKLYNPLYN